MIPLTAAQARAVRAVFTALRAAGDRQRLVTRAQLLDVLTAVSAPGSPPRPDQPSLELIGADEAAQILDRTPRRVRQLATDLDGRRIGGHWLFDRHTVTEYAQQKENRP